MQKICLLSLSLIVFSVVLHASDKENFVRPNASNISKERLGQRRLSADITQPKVEDSKPLRDEVNDLSRKVNFLRPYIDKAIEERKNTEEIIFDQIHENKEQQSKQIGELDKKITALTTSAIKLSDRVKARFDSQIVERVDHDLQPAVDGLTSQLKELLEKAATYEQQLQSAATREEFEQIKKELGEAITEISEAVEELPTSEDVKQALRDLTKGFKAHFVTNSQMRAQLGNKADRSAVDGLRKDIEKFTEQMPNRRVHALKQKMATKDELNQNVSALKEQLGSKANKTDLDAYATKDDIKGFVTREDLIEQLEEAKGTIPTVDNPQGLATQVELEQSAKALKEQLENKANKSDLNSYATKDDVKGFVSQRTHQEAIEAQQKTVIQLQDRIAALEKNSPKEQLKAGVIYFAKQGALGCAAYQLSPYTASLLQLLKLENDYVDLETVAVPITTGAISLLARLAKEAHDKGKEASLKEVAKESALDVAASAGVMGLQYMFFDDEMNEYVDQMSLKNRTAGYAGSFAGLRSLIALFKPSIY